MQYLGQTETAFRLRFNHKSHINFLRGLPLSKHMKPQHHSFEKVTVTILETGFKSNYDREHRESYVMHKFDAGRNGINKSRGTLSVIDVLDPAVP